MPGGMFLNYLKAVTFSTDETQYSLVRINLNSRKKPI